MARRTTECLILVQYSLQPERRQTSREIFTVFFRTSDVCFLLPHFSPSFTQTHTHTICSGSMLLSRNAGVRARARSLRSLVCCVGCGEFGCSPRLTNRTKCGRNTNKEMYRREIGIGNDRSLTPFASKACAFFGSGSVSLSLSAVSTFVSIVLLSIHCVCCYSLRLFLNSDDSIFGI